MVALMGIPPDLEPYTLNSFLSAKFPKPQWMVDGWIHQEEFVMVQGRHKTYKSFWVTQLVRSLVMEEPFMGKKTKWDGRPIVIIQQEIGDWSYQERLRTLLGPAHLSDILVLSNIDLRLDKEDTVFNWLDSAMKTVEPSLIVLDNLSKFYPVGFKPNDEVYASEITRLMKGWRNKLKSTVVLVHHDRKPGEDSDYDTSRGSGIWEDDPDLIIRLKKYRGKLMVTGTFRHAEEHPPIYLQFDKSTMRLEVATSASGYVEKATKEGISYEAAKKRMRRETGKQN